MVAEKLPLTLLPDWDAELRGPKTSRMRQFALEYMRDKNATQAAIRAGYSCKSAHVRGAELLRDARVRAVVAAHETELSKRIGMEVEEYARRTLDLALADVQSIVQIRRVCCRYCHSVDPLRPQLKPSEWQSATAAHERACVRAQAAGRPKPTPLIPPTDWFDVRKPPNPECLECRGEGEPVLHIADSRPLKGAECRLFRGVEIRKGNIKVTLLDQHAAWVNYGRIIGAFKSDSAMASAAGDVVDPSVLDALFNDTLGKMAQRRAEVAERRRKR